MYFRVSPEPSHLSLGIMTRILLDQFDGTVEVVLAVKISK